ncbi:MAG: glycoside hydrolase family 88 protein [Cyclobacteriaceae bacterium]|nr:glycoside hydrolase family 88 protein [Cyclobacteriaceae bacterium SS2]
MNITLKILGLVIVIMWSSCAGPPVEENSLEVDANQPIYVQMANSEIQRNPDPRLIEFRTEPKWEYTNGLLCLAILRVWEKTDNPVYYDYVKTYADSMITAEGKILTYNIRDYNIDRINPGKLLLELQEDTPHQKYGLAIETLREQMDGQPRTSEGGFWHKKRYPYQMWLDGLYMGSPFLAAYASKNNKPEIFDDVVKQVMLMDAHMYDEEKKLYYHGWDESRDMDWANDETGLSPHFWGRAMGWFSMALVDILDYLPADHPGRPEIISIVNKVAEGIVLYQDEETGVWWQILDMAGRKGNYLEASCSSMFSYFLLKAVNKGYIGTAYKEAALKAFEGVKNEFIARTDDGTISLKQICAVAGLGGNPYRDGSYEYYVGEPRRDNDPKGVGPFIMAAIEYEKMK